MNSAGKTISLEMVDLVRQYQRLRKEIDPAVNAVMEQAAYINGPEVSLFAMELAHYLNTPHVIACANGTDALQLALMALELEPGDEVITSSFSFVASAEVIALLGLKPVFADVCPDTYNICPEHVEKLITERTRVILPVHLFGQAANMQALMQIANRHSLYVVEDVAQSFGAEYLYEDANRKLGTIGHIGCTSFFPSKNLGCFGDGGACYTSDDTLAEKIRIIASHGSSKRYFYDCVGVNSRLDTLQAAILRVKLPYLDEFIRARENIAGIYNHLLVNVDGLKLPAVQSGATHTFNQYTIRVMSDRRNELMLHLERAGIPSRVYYPKPLHRQKAFAKFIDDDTKCPAAEMLCNEVLSIPVHPDMTVQEATYVAETLKCLFK